MPHTFLDELMNKEVDFNYLTWKNDLILLLKKFRMCGTILLKTASVPKSKNSDTYKEANSLQKQLVEWQRQCDKNPGFLI